MLGELVESRLQNWTTRQGSADRILTFGIKTTPRFESFVEFGLNGCNFELEPTVDGNFSFAREQLFLNTRTFLLSGLSSCLCNAWKEPQFRVRQKLGLNEFIHEPCG